jgi:hypothetical protein
MKRLKLNAALTLYFIFLIFPVFCMAADLKPWYGGDYELEIRSILLYQNYDGIAAPHHRFRKHTANDVFFTFSVAYPFQRYYGEFEASLAHTQHQNYRWDCFRVTGLYKWLNEIEGDPFSLVMGLTIIEPFSRAVHDISSFHHGHIEGEAHLSFGKKYGCPCPKDWKFRWWDVISYGVAEEGSPWLREDAAFEHNIYDVHCLRYFLNTLWGFGKNNLPERHFRGYGSIKHRSVDLGIRYSYIFGCDAQLSLQYARRVYAYNFPKNANLVLFEFYFPFGAQFYSKY